MILVDVPVSLRHESIGFNSVIAANDMTIASIALMTYRQCLSDRRKYKHTCGIGIGKYAPGYRGQFRHNRVYVARVTGRSV